jgi:hypothetical protein
MCDTASRTARCAVGLKRIRPILRKAGQPSLKTNRERPWSSSLWLFLPINDDCAWDKGGTSVIRSSSTWSTILWRRPARPEQLIEIHWWGRGSAFRAGTLSRRGSHRAGEVVCPPLLAPPLSWPTPVRSGAQPFVFWLGQIHHLVYEWPHRRHSSTGASRGSARPTHGPHTRGGPCRAFIGQPSLEVHRRRVPSTRLVLT